MSDRLTLESFARTGRRSDAARPTRRHPDAERTAPEIPTALVGPDPGGPTASFAARGGRCEERLAAVEDRLWIEWRADGEHLGGSGRLMNISRHGALIVACASFVEDQDLRIYLEDPAPHVGVSATVVGVIVRKTGMNQYRLRFAKLCPDAFLDDAAYGFETWMKGGPSAI